MKTPTRTFSTSALVSAITGALMVCTLARADVLELKNGQVLTVQYLGGTAGTVRFETSAGTQVIETSQALALTFAGGGAQVQSVAKPEDTIMVTCRSGGRSAIACNLLAQAGFKHVHNIIDGMEGDGNGDSESECRGGWKNSGCPWTKKLTPERMVLAKLQ